MSSTLNMNDVYNLVEFNQLAGTDARKLKPDQKKEFVELADRAVKEDWANKVLGGEDVLPNILQNRDKLRSRLAA